ncbi:potassium channel family protein [Micromonospora craniellae]|uniref:TrkA family potassium uptake protein n=1 Tax=Micromonospora craniellae TaxID=2294034 RepID=A0A372FRI6_9ACTN|nr:TrkA family potassium uptake protein [Micromonospora craniellae]QOC91356.1 TrkA family potassium uptake protein [Micromonospora craniellae]RFS43351.1 TrkA family potassium uptake protein [Micromonospora craniellae]
MARSNPFSFRRPGRSLGADAVVVIGLGRFGSALALELMATGTDVLGIDADEETVQSLNGRLTHVVRADSTKETTLRQLSVHQFDRAVVGIGSDLQSSILTTSLLLRFGVATVWAKATSDAHGEILKQLGTHHVVYPEHDMGRREAHLVRSDILDFIEIEDGFAMVKTRPPAQVVGRPLGTTDIRATHGITVVAVKPRTGTWGYATADTVLASDDTIIVTGETARAEAFGRLR